jgi:peptidoglycan/xylan/chitin deacetylase (PgdA/CDA1 family)
LLGRDWEAIATSRRVVALTFDAGSNPSGLPAILATLSARGVRGTFFLTGAFADANPASARAIVAGGHRIGNHSQTHPYFTDIGDPEIASQLRRAETSIRGAGGSDPRPLFRFPYGDRNGRTIAAVNANGYVAVRWTVDTLGWKGTKKGGITAQIVVDRVMAGARPGAIMMMHVGANPDDGTTLDAAALPTVIDQLRSRGYDFVTLDAMLTG